MNDANKGPQRVHYIHRLSYSTQERLVGIFVLGALAIVFMLLFINTKTIDLFTDTFTLHAYLKNAEGISTKTSVKVSGIEVGRVERLDISPEHKIHITLRIYERYRELIRRDSTAAIGKLSVLGRSTIDIEAGSTDEPMLTDGDSIEVEEPMSMDQLIAELTPVVQAVESSVQRFAAVMQAIEPRKVETFVHNLERSSADIRSVTRQIASGEGSIGKAVYDEALVLQLQQAVNTLERSLSEARLRLVQLEPVLSQADTISSNTGKASQDFPALAREGRIMLGKVNTTLTSLNVEAKQIPELITRMNVLMEQTDRLLEGISNSWLFSDEAVTQRKKLIEVQPAHE